MSLEPGVYTQAVHQTPRKVPKHKECFRLRLVNISCQCYFTYGKSEKSIFKLLNEEKCPKTNSSNETKPLVELALTHRPFWKTCCFDQGLDGGCMLWFCDPVGPIDSCPSCHWRLFNRGKTLAHPDCKIILKTLVEVGGRELKQLSLLKSDMQELTECSLLVG